MELNKMNLKFIKSAENKIKQITIRDLIVVLLAVSTLLACFLIWPVGAMKDTAVSSSGAENSKCTGALSSDVNVWQTFIPQYDYIRNVGILVDRNNGESDAGNFLLEIYDAASMQQRQVNFIMPDVGDKSQGYFNIPVNLKVIAGNTYTLRLYALGTEDKPVAILYRTKEGAGPIENQVFSYGNDEILGASLACSYTYGTPLNKRQIVTYDLFFLTLFFMLCALVTWLSKRRQKLNQHLTFLTLIQILLTAFLLWGWVFSFYYVFIRKLFGGDAWDFGIYGIAFIISMSIALFVIWKTDCVIGIDRGQRCILVKTFVQVLGFAVYFCYYAPYFNSGSNYGHYYNSCYMFIAFAVVVLSFNTGKQIFCWKNFIFSVLYWLTCGVSFLGKVHELNLEQRTLHEVAYIGGWLWGMVILITAQDLWHKKVNKIVVPYAALVAAFFALTWVFRYQKYWPIVMTVFFGLLYLQKLEQEQLILLMRNFCRGAVASFWYTWLYCLMHRPYHYNNFSRYNLNFSSVAIAGLYLIFVFTSLMILLAEQYKKDCHLRHMWFYYISMGAVLSYVFMSVSRTAMLSILGLTVILLLLCTILGRQRSFGRALRLLGAMAMSTIILFPTVYTLTRCVPAIVNDPVTLPYEDFQDTIYKNERKDSPKYMTFHHFLELSTGRFMTLLDGYVDQDGILDESSRLTYELGEECYSSTELSKDEISELHEAMQITYDLDSVNESNGEISNGRIAIFKLYLSRLNWTGHDSMVITVGDTTYAHAHNTFIQIAYDHGILCGIVFLLLGIVTLVRSLLYAGKHYETQGPIVLMPLMALAAFFIAGMTEWVFQPVIPLAFGVLFAVYPLLTPIKKQSQE